MKYTLFGLLVFLSGICFANDRFPEEFIIGKAEVELKSALRDRDASRLWIDSYQRGSTSAIGRVTFSVMYNRQDVITTYTCHAVSSPRLQDLLIQDCVVSSGNPENISRLHSSYIGSRSTGFLVLNNVFSASMEESPETYGIGAPPLTGSAQ